MRVLTFTSLFPNVVTPNSGIFIFQRTSHLAARPGNFVEVIAPVPYLPKLLRNTRRGSFASVPNTETVGKLRVHHPRYLLWPGISMPLHGLLMFFGCLATARKLHHRHQFDCIDTHYVFPDGLAAMLIGKSLRIPVVVSARGTDIHTFPSFTTIRPQICWTLRQAASVIAVSDSLAGTMLNLVPGLRGVDVIGNGVDSTRFFPGDRSSARRRLGFNPEQRLILCVAALRHVKGPDLLVRAVASLKNTIPGCKLQFIGAGSELADLRRLAVQLNCADICSFIGSVPNEELRTYYAAADLTCLPSRKEGWPNVILESLACGIPVVATRVGAVPAILTPELGILVDPAPESICAGLQRALQQDWNSAVISAYAQRYTWTDVATRVHEVLARSLSQQLVAHSAVCL